MSSDTNNGFLHLVGARLINSAFTQPLEYLKIAKQTGYAVSSSLDTTASSFQQRLSKKYTSVYQHQPEAIFKGLSMTLAQQTLFAFNLYAIYPFLVDHYVSISSDGNHQSLYNAELYAAATTGFFHGFLSTPFETIKLRQIGNTLMKNSYKDLNCAMEAPYTVKEFLYDPVKNFENKTKQKNNLAEAKRVNAIIKTLPKEKVLSYNSFEKLMQISHTPDQQFLEQMKKNKLLADAVYTNPATKLVDTVKEMMTTNPSVLKNFSNSAVLASIQASIQATMMIYSLQKMNHLTHYALTTHSDSYFTQFLQSFILAKNNDKFFSELAPIFVGVPSAFLTCVLTQPLDNIKTVLQSGQFDKFRQLSDSKQLTVSRHNIAEVLVKFYIANNNLKGLFSGFNLRFLRLSFLQTGFGYGVAKEIGGVWNKYSEARRLSA